MGRLSSNHIAELVGSERTLLDQTFGVGEYEIDDVDLDEAIIRTAALKVKLVYDRHRSSDVGTYISLFGVPDELAVEHPIDIWARFVGEDIPLLPRNRAGIISIPPDEQIRNDLQRVAHLLREVFTDPQRKRDAAHFASGYNTAYNDWASGKGSWAASN